MSYDGPNPQPVDAGYLGVASTTAYAPMCGGTSSTSPIQFASSGMANSGYVLTSTGSSSLPTFQPSSGSSSFTPNSVIQLYDDFIMQDNSYDQSSNLLLNSGLNWYVGGGASSVTNPPVTTNPGILASPDIGLGGGYFFVTMAGINAGNAVILLGAGEVSCNWVVGLTALSGLGDLGYELDIGMMSNAGSIVMGQSTPFIDGVWFSYNLISTGPNWIANAQNEGGGTITQDTGVAATTVGFHNFGFVVTASGGGVNYTIDGVTVFNFAAVNVPTIDPISPSVVINASVISSKDLLPGTVLIDLFYLQQTLTTAR